MSTNPKPMTAQQLAKEADNLHRIATEYLDGGLAEHVERASVKADQYIRTAAVVNAIEQLTVEVAALRAALSEEK